MCVFDNIYLPFVYKEKKLFYKLQKIIFKM